MAAQHTKLYLGGGYKVLGGDSSHYHLSHGCMSLCAKQCVNNLLLNGTESRGRRDFKDGNGKWWQVTGGFAASSSFMECVLYTQQCFARATQFRVKCLSSRSLQSKEAGARPLGHDSNSCSSSQVMPSDTETDCRNGPFKALAFQFGFSFFSALNVS